MKPVLTNDGSYTLYNEITGEHYHSIKGAVTESQHVFINAGLDFIAQQEKEIHILEAGLGTGLNALLTLQYAIKNSLHIHYAAIELFPVDGKIIQALNIPKTIGAPELENDFMKMHESSFDKSIFINDNFSLKKRRIDISEFETETKFNLVYYDAFSPAVQPELWSKEIFENIFAMMQTPSALVTYCAKGQVKRDLKSTGFNIEDLQGALGKREMIRAVKIDIV